MAKKVLTVGAALIDLLIEESDEFVEKMGVKKGGMNLVDYTAIETALVKSSKEYDVVPGGSACNTAVGLANLKSEVSFAGVVGTDELGKIFTKNLEKVGVNSYVGQDKEATTGRVLSIVTPDAQRTMFTYLGASTGLGPNVLQQSWFDGIDYVLLEGYLAFNEPCFRTVVDMAKTAGAKVCLDLSSFDVVQACRPLLDELMPSIDVLIANEDEAKAFTGDNETMALEKLAELAEIAIVKIGKEGVLLAQADKRYKVAAGSAKAFDTTGAGDLWASGFFYGLARDWDLDKCAELGSVVANEVVQVMGTEISEEGWARIKANSVLS